MNYRLNSYEKEELIRIFDENGYDITDLEKLSFELEEQGATYIGTKDDVVEQFKEAMGIQCPNEFLDENYIVETDQDWEELSKMRFLNIYRLFEEEDELKRLELNIECIKQQ